MKGGPVTSGFSANRGSSRASGMISGAGVWIATEQNDTARGSSRPETPTHALCHWRFASIIVTVEIGTSKSAAATRVIRSKRSSAGVSRISSERSASRRSDSFVWVRVATSQTVAPYHPP